MSIVMYALKNVLGLILYGDESFQWERGVTRLSSPVWPAASIVAYLVLLVLGRALISAPVRVPPAVSKLHNLALCVGSAVMFTGCLSAVIRARNDSGSWEFIFCTPTSWAPSGSLFFWSYVYYLSKYYEFLDTALLVLKAKAPSSLHIFHHTLVVVMSWLWVDQVQSLQFGGLLTNTAVHVVMYYYYYLTVDGRSPWWKRHITTLQILQFASSFCTLPFFFYFHRVRDGGCAGVDALAFNAAFNVALLALFAQFYLSTYRTRKSKSH